MKIQRIRKSVFMNRPRWLSFILIFGLLTFFWISLAAAASPQQITEINVTNPVNGLLATGNTTFGITIGAIILVTIIITSAIFRQRRSSWQSWSHEVSFLPTAGWVRRGRNLRTVSGPRGSSTKEVTLGAAGAPARRFWFNFDKIESAWSPGIRS